MDLKKYDPAVRTFAACALVLGLAILGTGTAHANEQVFRYVSAGNDFRGVQDIRTDPPTSAGDPGLVHPVQTLLGAGDKWVAIGTYKGGGAGDNCPSEYGSKWSIYVDWKVYTLYHCTLEDPQAYAAGDAPSFEMKRTSCPYDGVTKWVLSMGPITECIDGNGLSPQSINGMIETTVPEGGPDWNIDAKYKAMEFQNAGSNTWIDFGTGTPVTSCCYHNDHVSSSQFNLYQGTLD
jgi:hypothetical protein